MFPYDTEDTDFHSNDHFFFDENITEKMVLDDINEGLGLNSPPRLNINNSNNETTPCSQLYKKFPQLNTIITPHTLKNTMPSKGKQK